MISLQSHNQVLYHLTQLTSTITPLSSSLATKRKSHKRIQNERNEIICEDSMQEVINNISDWNILQAPTHYLCQPVCHKKSEVIEFLDYLSNGSITKFENYRRKWHLSYKSGNSFNDNKRNLMLEPFATPQPLSLSNRQFRLFLKMCHPHHNSMQVRYFKTIRSRIIEEREKTFMTKLKELFTVDEPTRGKVAVPLDMKPDDIEKLTTLMKNQGVLDNPIARMRTQVAFTEGYLAATDSKKVSRGSIIFKLLQYAIVMGLLLLTFSTLFGVLKS